MAQINIMVGGRAYALACRDGEEDRLTKLANHINHKAEDLSNTLGQMAEPRMLLMSALLVADELFETKEKVGKPVVEANPDPTPAIAAITSAAEQVEGLIAKLGAPITER